MGLKPCPFCGSTDIKMKQSGFLNWVECANCKANSGIGNDSYKAERLWNRRFNSAKPKSDELRGCPFCGSRAVVLMSTSHGGVEKEPQQSWVRCEKCKACSGVFTPEDGGAKQAIVNWNSRDGEGRKQ